VRRKIASWGHFVFISGVGRKKNQKTPAGILTPGETSLMVVDVQEKLCPTMDPAWLRDVIAHIGLMTLFARLETLPIIMTEQYPQGLGTTHPNVLALLKGVQYAFHSKLSFGGAGDPAILKTLRATRRRTVILTGMETHICVYLTALGLLEHGYRVFVCHDAVITRTHTNHDNGLRLMERAGAVITNTESAVFQMMGVSGTTTFKAISSYIKAMAETARQASSNGKRP
jgi:nicotinamidase-related amidase